MFSVILSILTGNFFLAEKSFCFSIYWFSQCIFSFLCGLSYEDDELKILTVTHPSCISTLQSYVKKLFVFREWNAVLLSFIALYQIWTDQRPILSLNFLSFLFLSFSFLNNSNVDCIKLIKKKFLDWPELIFSKNLKKGIDKMEQKKTLPI